MQIDPSVLGNVQQILRNQTTKCDDGTAVWLKAMHRLLEVGVGQSFRSKRQQVEFARHLRNGRWLNSATSAGLSIRSRKHRNDLVL